MNLLDVVKRPMITEKSMFAMDDKKYTSEISTRANKILVRRTVEATFDVKVKNVNIVSVHAKFKHMGKYTGYTKKHHKAIVTLTEGSKEVQLFEAAE